MLTFANWHLLHFTAEAGGNVSSLSGVAQVKISAWKLKDNKVITSHP